MRVLGLFDHAGVRRGQNALDAADQVSGPYCVQFLMDEDIDLVPVSPVRSRAHRKVRDVIEHRSGVQVDLAVRGIPQATRAEAVLCMLEDKAVLPARMREHRLDPYASTPLAAVSCWWAEEIERGTDDDRARIARTTSELDVIFTFSQNQVESFDRIGAAHKVVPISFGVDDTWYTPGAATPRFEVVAMGIDRGRDFASLVAAARLLPDLRFDIFTQPGRVAPSLIPNNVTMHAPTSMEQHRENLRSAQLVVVPTHELAYPTGQSVLLEGMSCGRCVAITQTKAMGEYIDDGRTNLAIPLHDPDGIATVIRRAIDDDRLRERIGTAAREAATQDYSFRCTWRDVANELRLLR